MKLRLTVILLGVFLVGLISSGFNLVAQPNQFNIANIQPNTLYPGTVFAVNGGQFIENNSEIYFGQSTRLETYFESENRLVAIVPLEPNICGEQGIIVKTEVNINNSPAQIDSNFVVKDIQCPNQNNLTPAAPEIDDITVLDVISGAAIRLRGENFIKLLRWIPRSLLRGGKRRFAVGEFCRYYRRDEFCQTSEPFGLRPEVPFCMGSEIPQTSFAGAVGPGFERDFFRDSRAV